MISVVARWHDTAWRLTRRLLITAVAACATLPAVGQPSLREEPAPIPRDEALRVDILQGTLRQVARTGVVRLAYRTDVVPFSFIPHGKRPIGYSIDLCRAIVDTMSQRLGKLLTITWVPVTAETRFDAITSGQADLECGASSNTQQRRQLVAFSPPVFMTGARLLVPRSQANQALTGQRTWRVGVVENTTAAAATLTHNLHLHLPNAIVVPVANYEDGYQSLTQDKLNALLADEVILAGLLAEHDGRGDYRMVGPWITHDIYGLAYRRDDPTMDEIVGRTLRRLAASGRLDSLYTRWFLRPLPNGERLGLPMNPALDAAIDVMTNQYHAN